MTDPDARLRRTLVVNASFSALSAIGLVSLSAALAEWAGLPRWVVLSVGIGLVPFAIVVAAAARRSPLDPARIRAIAVADFAWVAASAAVIAWPGTMTAGGKLLLAAISAAVLAFGVLEASGLSRPSARSTESIRADEARSA